MTVAGFRWGWRGRVGVESPTNHPLVLGGSLNVDDFLSCRAAFVPGVVGLMAVGTFRSGRSFFLVCLDAPLRVVVSGTNSTLRWEGALPLVVAKPLAVEAS